MAANHSYSDACRLTPSTPILPDYDTPPPLSVQYFYSSLLPIDDPSSMGSIATTLDPRSTTKNHLCPFSDVDNHALDKAWSSLRSSLQHVSHHGLAVSSSAVGSLPTDSVKKGATFTLGGVSASDANESKAEPSHDDVQRKALIRNEKKNETVRSHIVKRLIEKHQTKHSSGLKLRDATPKDSLASDLPNTVLVCCASLWTEAAMECSTSFCARLRSTHVYFSYVSVAEEVVDQLQIIFGLDSATITRPPTSGSSATAPAFTRLAQLSKVQNKRNDDKHASYSSLSSAVSSSSTPSQTPPPAALSLKRKLTRNSSVGGDGLSKIISTNDTMADLESRTRSLSLAGGASSNAVTSSGGAITHHSMQNRRDSSSKTGSPAASTPSSLLRTTLYQSKVANGAQSSPSSSVPPSPSYPLPPSQPSSPSHTRSSSQSRWRGKEEEEEEEEEEENRVHASTDPLASDLESGDIETEEWEEDTDIATTDFKCSKKYGEMYMDVSVGAFRLHKVSLPQLVMKPIYWSPVNDLASVLRATWFFRDSMLPVSPAVANQLEYGYRQLRVWTETWQIELQCAVEVGPPGEEKVSHLLWPEEADSDVHSCLYPLPAKGTANTSDGSSDVGVHCICPCPLSSQPFCAARCYPHGEVSAEGSLEEEIECLQPPDPYYQGNRIAAGEVPFSKYKVVYKDASSAFLLKPSVQASAYYGRRPVSKIVKGNAVGIPVVRGFDRDAWDALYSRTRKASTTPTTSTFPSHKSRKASPEPVSVTSGGRKSSTEAISSAKSDNQTKDEAKAEVKGETKKEQVVPCPACEADEARRNISDLVLVAHGIGQKFAERVESFHFTHAVNTFRRVVQVEMDSPAVRAVCSESCTGIMVLPVNWRHNLSFEDGGPMTEVDRQQYRPEGFGLKDIEPPTIPAVRSMISDVMFDIPFYMSHHKSKMIRALVQEANRVYRLWCRNNPQFLKKHGRVHLLGHSLGSVMAVDILSNQPTTVSPPTAPLSPSLVPLTTSHFEFNTSNLFLVGSPIGFFLLLERGTLLPRRGRNKYATHGSGRGGVNGNPEETDGDDDITGERGTFGCIAVDNIYNVLAKEDPIAYLLNGTIDAAYAASLETAHVPSATTSFFQSVGMAMKNFVLGGRSRSDTIEADESGDQKAKRERGSTSNRRPSSSRSSMTTVSTNSALGKTRHRVDGFPRMDHPSYEEDLDHSQTLLTSPQLARLPSQLELEDHDFTRETTAERRAYLLNDNGQVDYYLRSGGGPLDVQYLNMLGAHTSYWNNIDFVRMICVEISRKPGRRHTLPSLRAVKKTKMKI